METTANYASTDFLLHTITNSKSNGRSDHDKCGSEVRPHLATIGVRGQEIPQAHLATIGVRGQEISRAHFTSTFIVIATPIGLGVSYYV